MAEDEDIVNDNILLAGGGDGSAYSKYASYATARQMKVDTPEEMFNLTKLRQDTERKKENFDAKLQQGSKATASKGTDKTGVKTGCNAAKDGFSGSTGVGIKGNKAGASGGGSNGVGKSPSKTKQDAHRAQ